MTEIERIKRYIQRSGKKFTKIAQYRMNIAEAFSLRHLADEKDAFDAITIAFEYGRAKGYRAAKAEQRKKVKA